MNFLLSINPNLMNFPLKLRSCILFILLIVYSQNAHNQTITKDNFKLELGDLRKKFEELKITDNYESKQTINNQIIIKFRKLLQFEDSYTYEFSEFTTIGKVFSKDALCKIFTWGFPNNDDTYIYCGLVQYYVKKKKQLVVYQLYDESKKTDDAQNVQLTNESWYGSMYYEIQSCKIKKQTYYLLMGWDGNNDFTNKKILDVVYFDKHGTPTFGFPFFMIKQKEYCRIIFEYAERSAMALRYDNQNDMIVFDHLSPSKPEYENNFQFYGPDASIDGFQFEKTLWKYVEDIDVRLPKK